MASALLRRSAVTAALAAVATIASPLTGLAFAAAPALTAPTFSTTPTDSSGTVAANRPTFNAAYNTPLNTGTSTMTLTDTSASNAVIPCPVSFSNSNATISCTPSSDLTDKHVYKASVHAENSDSTSIRNTDNASYTVDIPSLTSITPKDGDVVGSGSTAIKAIYDEALDTSSFVRITDKDGNFVQGNGTLSASGPLPTSPKDTITYTPPSLPAGTYVVHVHAVANGNSLAFSDDFINYTVNPTAPTQAPSVTTAGATLDNGATHWINGLNQAAVPFAGQAEPNVRVRVVIYDSSTNLPLNCSHIGTGTTCQNDRTATVGVADCGQATCPWSLTVDTKTSSTPDSNSNYKYLAYAYTAGGTFPTTVATSGADKTIGKDTVAPSSPDNPNLSISGNTATVSDSASDPTTYAYKVVLADAYGHTKTADNLRAQTPGPPPAPATPNLAPTDVDVSNLYDGATGPANGIGADFFAYDQAANLSGPDPFGGANLATKESVTTLPDLAHSFVTVDGTNITLANINGKSVHTPTSITLKFNEPLRAQAATSSGNPPLYVTNLDLLSKTGFPISGNPVISADKLSFTWTLTGTPTDAGSPYSITDVEGVSASCPNSGATSGNCEEWPFDTQGVASSDPISSFTIDNTAPNVHVLGVNGAGNNGINADNIGGTVINGSVDADAASVTLAIKPATGSTFLVPSSSVTITPPSGGAATTTWHTSALNLSALSDGAATIVASASDGAGNSSPVDPAASNPDSTSRAFGTTIKARPDAPTNLTALAGNGQATLGWTAPTNTGAPDKPITGYSLTYTDTSVPGSAAIAAPSPSGTATTATVTGLANGHTYSFALSASNGSFSSPTATTTATPKGNTSLSAVGPGTVNYGSFVAVHGTLSYFGVGVANEQVTVTTINFNGTHGTTYHVTTDQNGGWVIAGLSPTRNTGYVASFAGDSAYNASSGIARVYVRVALRLTKATARSTSHVSPVTLHGTIKPSQTGRRVYIYERRANGSLHYLGYCKVSSRGTWVFTRTFSRGKHTLVARFLSQNGNIGGYSNRLRFSRT